MSGNLRHFFGAGLLRDGFVRDRPDEFANQQRTAQQLTENLQEAVQITRKALETIEASKIEAPHQSADGREFASLAHMLLQMAAHFAYHAGQVNYSARLFRADTAAS